MRRTGAVGVFRMLLSLRWKQFARAPQFGQRLAVRILMGLFGIYLLLNLLFVGYFLPRILAKTHPDANIVEMVNGYVLHVFLTLLVMRYFLQKMPAAQMQAFLTLPMHKSRLVLAYLGMLGLHGFNYVPIILALPLWVQSILPVYPLTGSLFWLMGILLLSLASAILVLLVKMFAFDRPLIFFAFLLAIVGLFFLDRLPLLAVLPGLSGGLYNGLLAGNWHFMLFLFAGTGLLSSLLFRVLQNKLYLAEGKSTTNRKSAPTEQFNQEKLQKSILLLRLELKILLRNKMAKLPLINIVLLSSLGMMYLMVQGLNSHNLFSTVLGILFLVWAVAAGYLAHAWKLRSDFFDGVLTRPIELASLSSTILMVAQLMTIAIFSLWIFGTAFKNPEAISLMIALLFYTTGMVNSAFLLFSVFDRKRYALHPPTPSLFSRANMPSSPFMHILLNFGVTIIPAVLVFILKTPLLPQFYISIGAIGLISLLACKFWIQTARKIIFKRKHIMAEGFRQS